MNERLSVIEEIFQPLRKKFKRRRVLCYYIDDLWQADLIEVVSDAKQNKGFKYILTVIDVFSKFAWVVPIKTKSSSNVAQAFESILKNGRIPHNLQTDNGE